MTAPFLAVLLRYITSLYMVLEGRRWAHTSKEMINPV